MNKDATNSHADTERDISKPQHYTKYCKQLRKVERGEESLPSGELTDWLPNTEGSALKTYIQVILYRPSRLYLYVCIYVCM